MNLPTIITNYHKFQLLWQTNKSNFSWRDQFDSNNWMTKPIRIESNFKHFQSTTDFWFNRQGFLAGNVLITDFINNFIILFCPKTILLYFRFFISAINLNVKETPNSKLVKSYRIEIFQQIFCHLERKWLFPSVLLCLGS